MSLHVSASSGHPQVKKKLKDVGDCPLSYLYLKLGT
jgi:hypothetical protein